MIFTKLKLKNFKSYEKAEIKFKEGISIIVGENGAGKSTILEAISFALFKQHTAKKIDDLVRKGARDKMVVELEFISNGKEYKIIREKSTANLKSTILKKTTSNSQYIPICTGDKEVNSEINAILDIDSDLFLNAIYIRQGEIAELVDKTSGEKKQLIGKLLGLDSLEKAWKNLQPFIANYERSKAELKGQLYSSTELNETYEKKTALLNSLKEKGLNLESKLKEVDELHEANQNQKLNLEREKEIYENFLVSLKSEQDALATLESDKKDIQEKLDEISEAEDKMLRLEKYVKKLPIYLDFEKSVVSIQQLKKDEKNVQENLESIKNQKAIVEAEKEGYKLYVESEENLEKLNNRKSNIEKELVKIAQLESDKKELLKGIEESRNEIESFFSRAKEKLAEHGLSADILDSVDNFSQLDKETDHFIEDINEKIDVIDEEINEKKEEIIKLKETIKSSQKPLKELETVDNVCPVCQSDIDGIKKRELVDYYNYNIEQSHTLIKEDEESLKLLKSNKESFEAKVTKVQTLSKSIVEYKYKFQSLEDELKKLKELDEALEVKDYTNSKLGELILEISNEKAANEKYKQSYENYTKAKGALDVLDSETETEYKLTQIANEIDTHVRNIQMVIEQDSHLTSDIKTEELQERIDDLKAKEEEYNQLKGFIKTKKSLEGQLISKKEDIDWKFNKIASIRNNIDNSKYDKDKYDKVLYSHELFERKHEEFSTELSTIKGQAKELIDQVNELTQQIVANKKAKKEYDNISEYLVILNNIRELYSKNGVQKDLRNYSRPLIQKYTKDFFNQFNFNYSDLVLDDEYNVTLFGPEGESTLNMVSGGEKIAIALALRLGITQVMSKGDLETIMLDEPTVHLDSFRRHELINLLKEMTMLPQMIIVTHENELENAADNLIKVEKKNGISEVEIKN